MQHNPSSLKRWFRFAILPAAILVAWASVSQASTSVQSSTISVTATVTSVGNFTQVIRSTTAPNNVVSSVVFSPVTSSTWSSRANQYITLTVNDNSASWRMRTYTNNFTAAPSTSVWGTQYGGMIGNNPGSKSPMAWMVLPDTGVVVFGGPAVGGPEIPAHGWTFFKDTFDSWASSFTATDPTTFANSDASGYDNVAFGNPSTTFIIRPNVLGGNQQLAAAGSPYFMFLESDFSSSPGDAYSSKMVVELINQ